MNASETQGIPEEVEFEETAPIPVETMAELVFGSDNG